MSAVLRWTPGKEDCSSAATAATTKAVCPGVVLVLFLLGITALAAAESGDSCPVSGPFTGRESCSVCQTNSDCVRSLGVLGASCNKGAAFVGGSASQAKSFRCNFTAPAALSDRIAPGAFVRCGTGIGPLGVGTEGPAAAGGNSAGCTFGLVISKEQVVCTATQCTIPPQSSLVNCLATDCECLGGRCKEEYVANLVGNLTGRLSWGCEEPQAPDAKPGILSCTLKAASLSGGSATALCDVGQCLRTTLAISESDVAEDKARLIEFRKTFGNGFAVLPDWGAASPDMCLWTGVSCNRYSRVVGLYLEGKGLDGSIPSPTGWLLPSALVVLDLTNNSVHGSIPPGMALPAPLLQLILPWNQISGSVPAGWVLPQNLTFLDLAHNLLSGTISSGWRLPSAVNFISLSNNRISGTVPVDWIGQLPASLLTLALSINQLSGSAFPPGLSFPPALEDYTCYSNRLNGELSEQWPFPPTIKSASLSGNRISGTLPPSWVLPPFLESLDFDANALSGTIPSTWKLPPSLVDLRLRNNSLTGTLPSWPNASKLAIAVKPGNPSLCGEVPSSPTYTVGVNFWEGDPLESLPACEAPGGVAGTVAPSEAGNEGTSGGGNNTTAIVAGSVAGGLALLSACALTTVWWRRTRQKHLAAVDDARTASDLPLFGGARVGVGYGSVAATPASNDRAAAMHTPRRLALAQPIQQSPFKHYALSGDVGTGSGGGQSSGAMQGGQESQESSRDATTGLLSKDALLASIVSRLGSRPSSGSGQSSFPAWVEPGVWSTPATNISSSSSGTQLVDVQIWVLDFRDLQLEKQIGTGSFGRVYVGRWQGIQVAVKLLLGDAARLGNVEQAAEAVLSLSDPQLSNLRKEASLMAALRHPNILGFMGLCIAPPALLSEYCPRGSLFDLLRAARQDPALAQQLTWAVRLHLATEAALGMMYLHLFKPAPVLHRDLKSNNLLVADNWTVKVADFNLSKALLGTPLGETVVSSTPAGFGNPRWQAPEVLAGEPHSFASDVFSYGIILYELLTWRTPWEGSTFWQVLNGVTHGQRPPIPSLEELPGEQRAGLETGGLDEYLDLMQRCWAQTPADRPTFPEVVSRLKEIAQTAFFSLGLQGEQGASATSMERSRSAAAGRGESTS